MKKKKKKFAVNTGNPGNNKFKVFITKEYKKNHSTA